MSLIDNDSATDGRGSPNLNPPDNVENRMSHNTNQNTYRTEGLGVSQRIAYKTGLILTYDSANRVSSVYGYIPELSPLPVLIIAKEGLDVFDDIIGVTKPEV